MPPGLTLARRGGGAGVSETPNHPTGERDGPAICRACNSHRELLALCEEMLRTLTQPSRLLLTSTKRELEPWIPMLESAIANATPTQRTAAPS